jgi:hypothetical protein
MYIWLNINAKAAIELSEEIILLVSGGHQTLNSQAGYLTSLGIGQSLLSCKTILLALSFFVFV